jgi:hypothetical protein
MLPFRHSDIIQNPAVGKETERTIMDGVIHSGLLNSFQQRAIDGLVQSGMPHHRRGVSHKGDKPNLSKSKKPATPFSPGFVKYPGSSMDS